MSSNNDDHCAQVSIGGSRKDNPIP
jgi:hypothetical protein